MVGCVSRAAMVAALLVPDEAVANLKQASGKSQQFATQACNLATQVQKQQKQAASTPALGAEAAKLPAGPL